MHNIQKFIMDRSWDSTLSVKELTKKQFNDVYDEMEGANMHSHNVVFLANRVGGGDSIKEARKILSSHLSSGSLTYNDYEKRSKLRLALEANSGDLLF